MQPWKENLYISLANWNKDLPISCSDENMGNRIFDLQQRIEDDTTRIVVFGQMKAGKSTFINALLGEELVQIGVKETTAVATKITYGPEFRIIAVSIDGVRKEVNRQQFIELSTEVESTLKEERLRLDHIHIETPNLLLDGITVIDTPGYNTPHKHHTVMSDKYLHYGDYSLWIFLTRNVGQETELEKIKEINEGQKRLVYGVVNAIDRLDTEEQTVEEYIDSEFRQLDGIVNSLIPVSSRTALEAKQEGNQKKLFYSGWPQVEELFEKLRLSDNEKNEQTFAQLSELLAVIQGEFAEERRRTPIHFYMHVMDKALQEDIPKLVSDYKDIVSKRKAIESEIHSLYEFMITPIDSEEAIHIHNANIERLNEKYGLPEPLNPLRMKVNEDVSQQVQNLNRSIEQLTATREAIYESWNERETPIFRKSFLEKLKERHDEYNHSLRRIKETRDTVQQELQRLRQQLGSHFLEVKNGILHLYSNLLEEIVELDLSWDEKWSEQNREFAKLPDLQLESLNHLRQSNERYTTSIAPFFEISYTELEHLHQYQQANYINETIMASIPELPVDEFKETKKMIMGMKKLQEIQAKDMKDLSFDYRLMLQSTIDPLPDHLALPIQREIERIKRLRNRVTVGLGVVALFILLVTIDLPQLFEREQKEYQSLESKEDFEGNGESDMVSYAEPEDQFEFTEWNEEHIMRFIHDLHYSLQAEDMNLVSSFSDTGWNMYQSMFGEIQQFTQSGIQQVIIEQVSADELVFSAREHFTVDSGSHEYTNRYTLHNPENPIIVEFFSEPILHTVEIDESDLEQFMYGYRDAYREALNGNAFGFVSPYLQEGSTAYKEIEDYIKEMSTMGAYFDFTSTLVNRMERTGPTSYSVQTTESFIYEDSGGRKTKYEKTKEYTVILLSSHEFTIESIRSLGTEKEEIIKEEIEVATPTGDDFVNSFVTEFYNELVHAMNSRDVSPLNAYVDEKGPAMDAVRQMIEQVDPMIYASLQQFDVEMVHEYNYYLDTVNVYVHLKYEVDGEFFAEEKFNQQLLVDVGVADSMTIEDIIWTNYVEE